NQMKNFTGHTSCSILPIEIRPEDLICLFAPEYTTIIEAICEKVNEIDEFLSCRRDKIESIKLSLTKSSSKKRATHGLSSYVYLNQSSTSVFLFDKHKHIHYILDDTISFIQQLINSYIDIDYRNCFLMKIATSYKELFPILIALSLALIILISWSSYYLEDFELYFQQLTLVNLNDDINQSEDEQKKLDEQKTKLTLLQTKLKQVKISTENAKLSYDDACNAEYIVRQKREEYLRQCIEREEKIENETKLQQHCVDDLEDNLKLLNEKYKIKLKNEQYQWCKNVIQCFQRISNEICKFIFNLVDKQPSTSTENYQNLLLILISLVRQDFLEPTKMKLDLNKIINIEQIVKEQLDQIFIYTKFLTEKDPMHNYLRFYRGIFYIGFCSLKNSLK
ncbi:unnamed protein product, partial [Rotaria sp. Silwood2]